MSNPRCLNRPLPPEHFRGAQRPSQRAGRPSRVGMNGGQREQKRPRSHAGGSWASLKARAPPPRPFWGPQRSSLPDYLLRSTRRSASTAGKRAGEGAWLAGRARRAPPLTPAPGSSRPMGPWPRGGAGRAGPVPTEPLCPRAGLAGVLGAWPGASGWGVARALVCAAHPRPEGSREKRKASGRRARASPSPSRRRRI